MPPINLGLGLTLPDVGGNIGDEVLNTDNLLLEDGISDLLQEDGVSTLLL